MHLGVSSHPRSRTVLRIAASLDWSGTSAERGVRASQGLVLMPVQGSTQDEKPSKRGTQRLIVLQGRTVAQ
jgi:hypothetical protein